MEKNLIKVIVIIVVLIGLILISPVSDYKSGTTCPYHTFKSDCLGLKFPNVFLFFEGVGGSTHWSCLGIVSNTKCYLNECSSDPNAKYEVPCNFLGNYSKLCADDRNAFSKDINSYYHCCNLVYGLCDEKYNQFNSN